MRDFCIADFNQEVIDEIMQEHCYDENDIVAVPYNADINEHISHVVGSWDNISKMIPILKEMDYTEMRLYYEDCGNWILQWHNPELDNSEWMLINYE